VDADGGIQHRVVFGQFDSGPAGGQREARNQNSFDPSPGSAFQNGFPVGVELVEVQMAVGICKFQGWKV
jgi:hypothetical protein